MKISLLPKLHNCDKHLKETNILCDAYGVIECDIICSVCGKIKNHWAYGSLSNRKSWKKDKKRKMQDLPF